MKAVWTVFYDAYWRFAEDDGFAIASHLALSALTSLFPFLIFLTALAGVFGSQDLVDGATQLLLEAWPERVAGPIAAEIHNVLLQTHTGLATLGAVLALYFSSSGIEAVRIGLNRAYGVRDKRSWWLLRIESIAYVLVGALALLAIAFLLVLGPLIWEALLDWVPALSRLDRLVTLTRFGVTGVIVTVALVIAHKWLPAERRSFAQIAPGVVFTLGLSILFAATFGLYLGRFARNYVSTYAGLASVMVALIFLYTLSSIFVFGGELNAALCRFQASRHSDAARQPDVQRRAS